MKQEYNLEGGMECVRLVIRSRPFEFFKIYTLILFIQKYLQHLGNSLK